MSGETLVAAVERNDVEELRIYLDANRSIVMVDFRIFEQALGPAKVRVGTRRGFAMPAASLDAIIAALETARHHARTIEAQP